LGVGAFYGANAVLRPKSLSVTESRRETRNYRISAMLPYMTTIDRPAHYVKVVQRENIGSWKDRQTLQKELNAWINQYVTDMDSPSPDIRAKWPLRFAKIDARDGPEHPGWHFMNLRVTSHFKFIGASFTLKLTGKLDLVHFNSQ
jgi:type VI secretion system protein ImpC